LAGNTAAELVPHDREATELVARLYRRFTDLVTVKARPEAQAQLLLYLVQGLSLVSRASLDKTAALAAIDTAIDALRA